MSQVRTDRQIARNALFYPVTSCDPRCSRKLKNVHATPHIGAQTVEAQLKSSVLVAERVIAVLEKSTKS